MDGTSRAPEAGEPSGLQGRLLRLSERVLPADTGAGERLAALAAVVGSDADDERAAQRWAFADLRQAVDAEGLAERAAGAETRAGQPARLEAVRNSLVFAPLILTWLAIFDAAGAYAALAQSNPAAAGLPFLYLWQGRFGGHGLFALGGVALADAALLLLLLALTPITAWRASRHAARERDAVNALRQEIDSALAEADLELAARRQPQPYAAISQLERTAIRLHQQVEAAGGRVTQLAAEKEHELSVLAAFTPRLAGGVQAMQAAAERLEAAQDGFARMAGELAAPITELGRRQAELSEALRQSAGRAGALQAQQEKAAQQAGEMARQQAALLAETRAQSGKWEAALSAFTPVAAAFGQAAADLAQAQTQLLARLGAERDAQARLADAITQANGGLAGAVARVSGGAEDMAALTAELRKLAGSLPDLAQSMERRLWDAADAQARTAGELRAAGQALAAAAARIEDATRDALSAGKGRA